MRIDDILSMGGQSLTIKSERTDGRSCEASKILEYLHEILSGWKHRTRNDDETDVKREQDYMYNIDHEK